MKHNQASTTLGRRDTVVKIEGGGEGRGAREREPEGEGERETRTDPDRYSSRQTWWEMGA